MVESGISLTNRHLSNPRKRRGLNQIIWEDILEAVDKEVDLDSAFNTNRIFQNQLEGIEGLKD